MAGVDARRPKRKPRQCRKRRRRRRRRSIRRRRPSQRTARSGNGLRCARRISCSLSSTVHRPRQYACAARQMRGNSFGMAYSRGFNHLRHNAEEAERWLRRAAARAMPAREVSCRGCLVACRLRARPRAAADQGNARAQVGPVAVSIRRTRLRGYNHRSRRTILSVGRRSGLWAGQLAELYESGRGVPRDDAEPCASIAWRLRLTMTLSSQNQFGAALPRRPRRAALMAARLLPSRAINGSTYGVYSSRRALRAGTPPPIA